MFWPDATLLSEQDWWDDPAWEGGPGYGELVEALRPVLRAVMLLGWLVHSIDLGIGRSEGQSTEWTVIELATLELVPAVALDVDKPFDGPNLHLGVAEIVDLHGRLGDEGDYAIPIDIPVFGSDDLPDDAVPAGLAEGVDAFVNEALDELAPTVPTDPVLAAPRASQQGLLWMLYTNHWRGLTEEAKFEAGAQTVALRQDPMGFLMGQLYGQQVAKPAAEFWDHLALSVQARGEAHRLPQRARIRLPAMGWLDALTELMWRGAIIVDGLVEPAQPPQPIEAFRFDAAEGDPVTELTLSIWEGDAEITLRRWLTFDDEAHATLTGSVAWDYVPGDDQQRPTVVVVAGRGVQIVPDPEVILTGRSVPAGREEEESPETARIGSGAGWDAVRPGGLPWDLLIHRVQDDALVPAAGAKIDPVVLLGPSVIDPDPPLRQTGQDSLINPQPALLVIPKHDGVLLQFPARGTGTPGNTPVDSVDIPRVIELTIPDPTSGTSAWTADVHFYTYDPTARTVGGAHLCVWVTEDIQIHTNDSPRDCYRGDPSSVFEKYWFTGWQYSAEFFEADPPTRLRRPFSALLPFTESAARRPDRLQGVPHLDYDGHAIHDGMALIPALHCYRQFGYKDSLAFVVMDILISFVPFVGEVADIGEAVWAWQTGTDKWGRPVSQFELALMIAAAAVPILGSGVLRQIGGLLARPISDIPVEDLSRLAEPARWSGEWPLDSVSAIRGISETTLPDDALVSPGNKAKAEELVRALAADDSTIRALATRLSAGRAEGWPTVGDVLSQDGTGFSAPVFQTAYLRFLRDHAGSTETPSQYVARLQGGRP